MHSLTVVLHIACDGNCGYYSVLAASAGGLEHTSVAGRLRSPTAYDYKAQKQLREKCVAWALAEAQCKMRTDIDRGQSYKVATETAILAQLNGKNSPHDPAGAYANSLMLKAMAVHEKVGIVVINTKRSAVPDATPLDRVRVYHPDKLFPTAPSWANEVAPRILRQHKGHLDGGEIPYRVILHNGAAPGALNGHFDATATCIVPS